MAAEFDEDKIKNDEYLQSNKHQLKHHEHVKHPVVVRPYAVVDPWTVVVEPVNASIALLAVPTPCCPFYSAVRAQSCRLVGNQQLQKVVRVGAFGTYEARVQNGEVSGQKKAQTPHPPLDWNKMVDESDCFESGKENIVISQLNRSHQEIVQKQIPY